eukprot:7694636-Pyramimonas_sp.AAC.1
MDLLSQAPPFIVLRSSLPTTQPQWASVLDKALSEKCHALIDCGALMAGATNRQVAEYACPLLDPKLFKGV